MGKTGKWKAHCKLHSSSSRRAVMQQSAVQENHQEDGKQCYRWHQTCTHSVTTVTQCKGKKYVVPLSGPQFLLLMCRSLFLLTSTQQNSSLKQSCSTDNWSDAPSLWDAISSISGAVNASDHTHSRATEWKTYWNEFSAFTRCCTKPLPHTGKAKTLFYS